MKTSAKSTPWPALDRLARGALRLCFPPDCLCCGIRVDQAYALCPDCWQRAHFLRAPICQCCGAGLPAATGAGSKTEIALRCDDCLRNPPPWDEGRAVFAYAGAGRDLVLGLKHGDRADIAKAAARWMARAAQELDQSLWADDPVILPIPLHPTRLIARRFNQTARLALGLAHWTGCATLPDGLIRLRRTRSQDGLSYTERCANLADAIAVHPRARPKIDGRAVILVDDVITSGATFRAATQAVRAAGAKKVSILALARAGRKD